MIEWNNEVDNLKQLIEIEKLPYNTIGNLYGVSGTMIRKIWKKFGFTLENRRKINEKETFNKGKKLKTTKEKSDEVENSANLYCVVCGKELRGRQTKYCSIECKRKDLSYKKYHTEYSQKRDANGMEAKINIIKEMGGKCEICGYNKNVASLCFHHINPLLKKFTIDSRNLVRYSKEKIRKELENCQLLCQNCHHEIHHPQYNNLL